MSTHLRRIEIKCGSCSSSRLTISSGFSDFFIKWLQIILNVCDVLCVSITRHQFWSRCFHPVQGVFGYPGAWGMVLCMDRLHDRKEQKGSAIMSMRSGCVVGVCIRIGWSDGLTRVDDCNQIKSLPKNSWQEMIVDIEFRLSSGLKGRSSEPWIETTGSDSRGPSERWWRTQ